MIRLSIFVFFLIGFVIWYFKHKGEPSPTKEYNSIDALVPAFNEEVGIELTIKDLLNNRYVRKVVCVDDGSTDNTGSILDGLQAEFPERIIVVHQTNMGKAQALNNGLKHIETSFFLATDADTRIPDDEGIGYMAAHLKGKTVAVSGIPASNLMGAGILPKIRASTKVSFTIMRKGAMEIIGGSPHVISGSCGLYRTEVIKRIGIPDRTAVEDMDLTWTLVEHGYRVGQSRKFVVYVQECNSLREEMVRWKRWIAGYAICMRIHGRLMFSRFGIGVILPVAALGMCGLVLFYIAPIVFFYAFSGSDQYPWWIAMAVRPGWGPVPWWVILSPFWIPIVMALAIYSAKVQKNWKLIIYSPFSVLILLIFLWTWLRWGIPTLITGKEPVRIKPRRY